MTSFSDYQLYWYDVRPGEEFEGPLDHSNQYVFESVTELPTGLAMSRVKSVHDVFELIQASDKEAPAKVVVGVLALLGGNLVANHQWTALFSFVAVGVTVAVLQLRVAAMAATAVLILLFLKNLWEGCISLEWVVTVALVMLVAIISVVAIRARSRQDPRNYVLLKEEDSEALVIYNRCHMDVKVLFFLPTDTVRFVPIGGLVPRHAILPRGSSLTLGHNAPYTVSIFDSFEDEIGCFVNAKGCYSLRATFPPVSISRSEVPAFANCSEVSVVLCICGRHHWTSSLWLPLASIVARIAWRGQVLFPGQETALPGRACTLRVYTGLVGLARGVRGGLQEQVCCAVEPGERVDYVGNITWTQAKSKETSSAASFFNSFRSLSHGASFLSKTK